MAAFNAGFLHNLSKFTAVISWNCPCYGLKLIHICSQRTKNPRIIFMVDGNTKQLL